MLGAENTFKITCFKKRSFGFDSKFFLALVLSNYIESKDDSANTNFINEDSQLLNNHLTINIFKFYFSSASKTMSECQTNSSTKLNKTGTTRLMLRIESKFCR